MSSAQIRQEKKSLLSNYVQSLSFGLLTLLFSTIAITYGFVPLLKMTTLGPHEWLALGVIAVLGFVAFEASINFRVSYDAVVEHRKRAIAENKKARR